MPEAAAKKSMKFKPPQDSANAVPQRNVYSPSIFSEDARAYHAERSAATTSAARMAVAERHHWTAHMGVIGVGVVVAFSLVSITADTTRLAGISLGGSFAGLGLFALANRLAYITGERTWIGPEAAAGLTIGCAFLCLTAVVAGLTG